jgi:NADPH:quinone reductase-like Zn-dependent oxidoreductase
MAGSSAAGETLVVNGATGAYGGAAVLLALEGEEAKAFPTPITPLPFTSV